MTSNGTDAALPLPLSLGLALCYCEGLVLGLGFARGSATTAWQFYIVVPGQLDFNYCINAAPTNFVVI